jgi:hypothetical protein
MGASSGALGASPLGAAWVPGRFFTASPAAAGSRDACIAAVASVEAESSSMPRSARQRTVEPSVCASICTSGAPSSDRQSCTTPLPRRAVATMPFPAASADSAPPTRMLRRLRPAVDEQRTFVQRAYPPGRGATTTRPRRGSSARWIASATSPHGDCAQAVASRISSCDASMPGGGESCKWPSSVAYSMPARSKARAALALSAAGCTATDLGS